MSTVYLIPSALSDDGFNALPLYIEDAVKNCQVFFVENERSARRYLKKIWKNMVIDDYEWQVMSEDLSVFEKRLKENKTIGIISEAGCPGIADPGQLYIAAAQRMNIKVKPLTGPNSILLALMASGMNGQCFKFHGYLPIASAERIRAIKELESVSRKDNCTQIFIETPYRNNQLLEALIKTCQPATRLCLAVNITAGNESIQTKSIAEWKNQIPDIHKKPAIFLVYSA